MSYYANLKMWEKIEILVTKTDCKFSVWMDDICISGENIPRSLIWNIKQAIYNSGFSYHKEKFYNSKEAKNITGIIVTKNKIMARKGHHKKLRDLRRMLDSASDPATYLALIEKVDGLENFIKQVEN